MNIVSIHCLGLFESYDSIKDINKGNQVKKNHNNDNYNYYSDTITTFQLFDFKRTFFFGNSLIFSGLFNSSRRF